MNRLEPALLLLFPLVVFLISLYYYPVEPSEAEALTLNETRLPEAPKYVKSVIVASRSEGPAVKQGRVVDVKNVGIGSFLTVEDGERARVFVTKRVLKEPEELVGSNVTLYGHIVKTKRGEAMIASAIVVEDERPEPKCFVKEGMEKKCEELKGRHRRPTYR
ncbi:MAG: hypothetical protein ABDH61_06115 [Acidilobaceae archaeon]